MNKITSTTVILGVTFVVVLLSYFALTIEVVEENGNLKKNSYVNDQEIFAQEENESPVVKNSKVINFSGVNYADIVNSRDIHLNSFTVSTWFNTNMNVTGQIENAFLIKADLELIEKDLTLIMDYGLAIEKELMEGLRLQLETIII